ncbi:MAG: diaminopimelate decarboxylase [Deltaproteobacteria bacterium]|nr:diaminopimelate decarboxylase [Deltaproteobacteria bacterium]
MPMSEGFRNRLEPILEEVVERFKTPFHIYDEQGIRDTGETLKKTFSGFRSFREFFAVKALPNPSILSVMKSMGFGFDCSSIAELKMSRGVGAGGEDIMFTSNNTMIEEFDSALSEGGCILNLDDITLIPKVPRFPERICFRYNPGPRRTGNSIIGNPSESKYGVSHQQLVDAYRQAMDRGAKVFGLHTMLCSNERQYEYMVATVRMLLEQVERGIEFEFINIGGGLGIPYEPLQEPLDIQSLAAEAKKTYGDFRLRNGYAPKLYMESGRYMTGPHGVLVTKAINSKHIYREYVGVDACMSSLMRPGMYGAYHHITVLGKDPGTSGVVVDVVGSLCENNDKFAVQRLLPRIEDGDILMVHDTGAHGHAMGFNYNGRLRPKELLLRSDGSVELIRREETLADYFATLQFERDVLR